MTGNSYGGKDSQYASLESELDFELLDEHLICPLLVEIRQHLSEQLKLTYGRTKLLQDEHQAPHIKLFLIDGINYFLGLFSEVDRKTLLAELHEQQRVLDEPDPHSKVI